MIRAPLISVALVGLAGCASAPSDFAEEYHLAAEKMVAYQAGVESVPAHAVLAPVSSNSCDSTTFARYAGDTNEAIYLLKLETAKLGGDAVVDYSCRTKGVDWVSNCWASKRCEGRAAKLQ